MGKKVWVSCLAVLLGFCFISTDSVFAGNKRKGKIIYKKVYKACQARGKVQDKRPVLSPDSKTQAQWKIVFDQKKFEQFGCKEEWDQLTDKQLEHVFTYLHAYAADSPAPAKCK